MIQDIHYHPCNHYTTVSHFAHEEPKDGTFVTDVGILDPRVYHLITK